MRKPTQRPEIEYLHNLGFTALEISELTNFDYYTVKNYFAKLRNKAIIMAYSNYFYPTSKGNDFFVSPSELNGEEREIFIQIIKGKLIVEPIKKIK